MVRSISRRDALRGGGAILVSGVLAGCSGNGGSLEPKIVEMTDDPLFDPEILSVDLGQAVLWVNNSSVQHTVTTDDTRTDDDLPYFASGGYDSEADAREGFAADGGILQPGDRYEHTFETGGNYGYFCIIHEDQGMTGMVNVSGGSMF